jgi:hypothetical protein
MPYEMVSDPRTLRRLLIWVSDGMHRGGGSERSG